MYVLSKYHYILKRLLSFASVPLFLILLFSPFVSARQSSSNLFDLERVLATALERNRSLEAARYGLEASEWNVKKAYSEFLPKISLSQRITKVDDISVRNANFAIEGVKSFPGFEDIDIPPFLYKDTYETGISVTLPIYNGGRLINNLELAKKMRESEEFRFEDAEDELVFQVVTAFFNYAKSREIILARQKAVDLSEINLRNAQAKNELGIRPRSDILRWEAQVATDKANLIEAENSASIQKISLANLIGIDLFSPFEIVSVPEKEVSELFVKYSALVTGNIEQQTDRLYGDAVVYNSGRTLAFLQTEVSRVSGKIARSGFLPQINLAYNYSWQGNDTPALDGFKAWNATIQVTYSIFNGFSDYSDIQKARAETMQSERMEQEFDRGLEVSIYSSLNTIKTTLARIALFEKNLTQARDNLSFIRSRYNLGLASNIDLVDAQSLETNARVNLINSRYDLFISGAELDRTVGRKVVFD